MSWHAIQRFGFDMNDTISTIEYYTEYSYDILNWSPSYVRTVMHEKDEYYMNQFCDVSMEYKRRYEVEIMPEDCWFNEKTSIGDTVWLWRLSCDVIMVCN